MPGDIEQPETGPQRLSAHEWRIILAREALFFEVLSDSMKPVFHCGDQVLIRPLEDDEPHIGQVLAFHRGMLFTHRYLGKGICAGDNSLNKDAPIQRADMVGIVTSVQRGGKLVPIVRRSLLRIHAHRLRLRIGDLLWRRRRA